MKILLATDGSAFSEGAAGFLTKFGFTADDEILVLYALTWMPAINELEAFYLDFREIRDAVVPDILASTEGALKGIKAKVSSRYLEDFPDSAIIGTAEKEGVDLIVMGARGLRGIDSYIVGSVTRSVAVKSGKPVFVVKPAQQKAAGNLKILFAADGSVNSDKSGNTLSGIPFPGGTEVTLLNAVTSALSDIPDRFAPEIDDRLKRLVAGTRGIETAGAEKILKQARESLKGKFKIAGELIRFGDPSDEILKAARELNADIIALGSSGMRGIKGMLGSVSRYVLNHAGCSVFIGKG